MWKEKGGDEVFVTYEVKTHVTVRVEIPPGELGFDCDDQLKLTVVEDALATQTMGRVALGTRLVAFNDKPLGAGVPWPKVRSVVTTPPESEAVRAFTFAVVHPFIVKKR